MEEMIEDPMLEEEPMEEPKSDVVREPGELSVAREGLVKQLVKEVDNAKSHWEKAHKRIREDMKFAFGEQWEGKGDEYQANITHRHVQQSVASLYAKDPRAVATPKPRMDYQVWDGTPGGVMEAQQQLMMDPLNEQAMVVLQEAAEHQQRQQMLQRLGTTLERVYEHYVGEQVYPFKKQMKRLVRRTLTTGVGYLKLDYQRVYELSPDNARQLADLTTRLADMKRITDDLTDGELDGDSPEVERLQAMAIALQEEGEELVREGLIFDFPNITSIIPDTRCRSLDGFIGCDWVAQEYLLTPAEIQTNYSVDIRSKYQAFQVNDEGTMIPLGKDAHPREEDDCDEYARLIEVYHKRDGVTYTLVEGWPDFIKEPEAPNVFLERFFPIFTLMFNECEHEQEVYPPSDVRQIMPMQREYNRAREGLREHRIMGVPQIATPGGMLDEEDKVKLQNPMSFAVLELNALMPQQSVDSVLQAVPKPTIDPALYETENVFSDMLRTVGTQEANLGGMSGNTATESSIAEGSRTTALESKIDDLDAFLTEMTRCAGQVLMSEVTEETVKQIVGMGAFWPMMTKQEIMEEMSLDIEAGSTGRPNRVQDLQNMERLMPYLIQIPGIDPEWMAREMIKRMDDRLDLNEAVNTGLPSIVAMNSMAQTSPGPADEDPNAQGEEGGENTSTTKESENRPPSPGQGAPGRPPLAPVDAAQLIGR